MSAAVLADLATLINTEHSAAQSAYGSALEHALRVGELLTQAKTQCAHGAWLPWLSENCPEIAERTAQAYMRLHRERDRLPKSATVADLTVRGSLEFLVDPPPAPEAAQEQHEPDVGSGDALDRVQAGICDDADADKALLRAGDIAAASRCAARIRDLDEIIALRARRLQKGLDVALCEAGLKPLERRAFHMRVWRAIETGQPFPSAVEIAAQAVRP